MYVAVKYSNGVALGALLRRRYVRMGGREAGGEKRRGEMAARADRRQLHACAGVRMVLLILWRENMYKPSGGNRNNIASSTRSAIYILAIKLGREGFSMLHNAA